MKKIISISLISASLLVLVNCSPKSSKKVASDKPQKTETARKSEPRSEETPAQKPMEAAPQGTDAPSTSAPQAREENPTANTSSNNGQTNAYSGLTPQQQVDMFKKTNEGRVIRGKSIYESSCKKCHTLHQPSSRTALQWVTVMNTMGPKAKLGEAEYMYTASYLVQNAKP
jgi:cytochrome c5